MHSDLQRLLQEAARLTRQGDLNAATRAIQQALGAQQGAAHPRDADEGVIDVEAREVPDPDGATALPGPEGVVAPAPRGAACEAVRPAPAPAPVADAGSQPPTAQEAFLTGRHGGAGLAGRSYKLYVPPAGSAPGPRPLVLMLHGCTQDPDDFAAGTRMNELAREQGWFVLYPEQSQRANPQRCWNWFKHSHQQRGRGEPEILAGMVREVMARHPVDPARVYVAGLSAGGAMAAVLAAAYPELFAAAGVHSGLPAAAARDLPSALQAMKNGAPSRAAASAVPTIVFHGDAGATVHPANGEQVVRAAAAAANDQRTESGRSGAGRRFTRHVHRDPTGQVLAEHWVVHGAPHAWSGGSRAGSYTDPQGPDASAEMLRFFREHPRG